MNQIEAEIKDYARKKKRESNQRYREQNYEIILAYNRDYQRRRYAKLKADPEAHEQAKAKSRQYYRENRDKLTAYQRDYYRRKKAENERLQKS